MIKSVNDDYLFEMARVSKEDTGLPYDLWIDSNGKDRKSPRDLPRLKVEVNGNRVPVSISGTPEILVNKEIPEFRVLRYYIIRYLDVLLKHWNKELTDRQALNLLNK